MDLTFDAITGARLTSTAYSQVATDLPGAKLQSSQPLRIQYTTGGSRVPCAAPGTPIKFGLKRPGHFSDGTFDVYADSFTAPSNPTAPDSFYVSTLTLDSALLRGLFPVGTDGTSPDSVMLIGEVSAGGVPSQTFDFVVDNNVIKGTESPAVSVPGTSYPPPDQVDTIAARDTAIATAISALPAPGDGSLPTDPTFATVTVSGAASFDGGLSTTDGYGGLLLSGPLQATGGVFFYAGMAVTGGPSSFDGGSVATDGGGTLTAVVFRFPDGSFISSDGETLYWTKTDGTQLVFLFA